MRYLEASASKLRSATPVALRPFFEASLLLPLDCTLVPQKGSGSPTFSRATTATFVDHDGIVRTVPSGGARFYAARMVRNWCSKSDMSAAGATVGGAAGSSPPTITTATYNGEYVEACTFPAGGSGFAFSRRYSLSSTELGGAPGLTVVNGGKYVLSGVFALSRALTGGEAITIYVTGAMGIPTSFVLDSTMQSPTSLLRRSHDAVTCGGAGTGEGVFAYPSGALSSPVTLYTKSWQIEDVSGQVTQTCGEYVSSGMLSAPYHGAGVDGVKFFKYKNGNSLSGALVTEATGASITNSGLLFEGSRTNYLTYSNDCTNAAWVKTNVTAAKTATGADGLPNSASTLTATLANGTCLQTLVRGSVARVSGCWIKRRTGSGTINMTQDNGATWTAVTVTASWSRVSIPVQTIANPIIGFQIVTNGDAVDVWGIQHEEAGFLSETIETTAAATTRATDDLYYPKAGNVNQTTGACYAEIYRPSESTIGPSAPIVTFGAAAGAMLYLENGQPATSIVEYDGTTVTTKAGLSSPQTAFRKRASSWGATTLVTGDGAAPASGAFDGIFGSGAESSIYVGSWSGNQFFGAVRNVALWNRTLTSAELQGITT